MIKKKLILIGISMSLTITTLVVVVFAWFNFSSRTPPIIINLGELKLEAKLYNDDTDEEITSALHFYNLVPGDEFDYRLELKNIGNLAGILNATFTFGASDESLLEYGLFKLSNETEARTFEIDYQIAEMTLIPYDALDDDTLVIILFKVKISPDLELSNLLEETSNYLILEKITITLQQPEPEH